MGDTLGIPGVVDFWFPTPSLFHSWITMLCNLPLTLLSPFLPACARPKHWIFFMGSCCGSSVGPWKNQSPPAGNYGHTTLMPEAKWGQAHPRLDGRLPGNTGIDEFLAPHSSPLYPFGCWDSQPPPNSSLLFCLPVPPLQPGTSS